MKTDLMLKVWILCLMSEFRSSTSLYTDAYFYQLTTYNDRFPVSEILWDLSTSDEITCAERCTSDLTCRSFFFEAYSNGMNCYGSQYRLTEAYHSITIATVFKPGMKYYQIDRGCGQPDYIYDKEHNLCFHVSITPGSKTHADLVCQASGGRLVVLDTVTKFQYMVDFMRTNYNDTGCYVIGVTDTITEGTWLWSNGVPMASDIKTNFKENNKDMSFSDNRKNDADCACLNTGVTENLLSDKHCDKVQRFICEI